MTASCDGMHVVISDLVFFYIHCTLFYSCYHYHYTLFYSCYPFMYISNKLKLHLEQSHEVQYVQVW